MKNKKLILAIVLLALGFIFTVLDIKVNTGINYPNEYENTTKTIGEFQYYNIHSNYGAKCTYKLISTENADRKGGQTSVVQSSAKVIDKVFFDGIRFDIFNDFAGFLFMLIGCLILIKCSHAFKFAALCSVGGFSIHAIIALLPFFLNGSTLCNAAFCIGTIYLACNLLAMFFVVRGLLHMCPGVCCRDERKWCKLSWVVILSLQILTTFTFWLGSDYKMLTQLSWFFKIVLVIFIICFFIILKRASHYIEISYNKSH